MNLRKLVLTVNMDIMEMCVMAIPTEGELFITPIKDFLEDYPEYKQEVEKLVYYQFFENWQEIDLDR